MVISGHGRLGNIPPGTGRSYASLRGLGYGEIQSTRWRSLRGIGAGTYMNVRTRGMGMGQAGESSGTIQVSVQDCVNAWLNSLRGELGVDAAVGCGPGGGAPCGSPQEAAQMVYQIAADCCQTESYAAIGSGAYTPDPACADGGKAVADAAYKQALAFFSSLPPSVWSQEAANAASGDYYGPIGGAGGPRQVSAGGTVVSVPAQQTVYGPPVNITTGAPITNALATAVPSTPATPSPQQIAGGQNQSGSGTPVGAGAGSTSTSTSTSNASVQPDAISQWLQSNWIILAAAAGALLLMGKA